jgi:hypothetical protein
MFRMMATFAEFELGMIAWSGSNLVSGGHGARKSGLASPVVAAVSELTAKLIGVGTGTVHRIKREMAGVG